MESLEFNRGLCLDPILSIIIPTKNRVNIVLEMLESLLLSCSDYSSQIECIVVDNGSTDNTKDIVLEFANKACFPVSYIYEQTPGLHVGRNIGAQCARGEWLAYLDDDVLLTRTWVASILKRISRANGCVMIGGPLLPLWEKKPPAWVEEHKYFLDKERNTWLITPLSLVYQGEKKCKTKGFWIFGANMIMKRRFVIDCGGFHPDGMPERLLVYRGDGETGMAVMAEKMGATIIYEPLALVMHKVPPSRVTRDYFEKNAKRNGISFAYSAYRYTNNWLYSLLSIVKKSIEKALVYWMKKTKREGMSVEEYDYIMQCSSLRHYIKILTSPTLKKWVRQKSYFLDDWCPYADEY